jgi:hypothetical protein
MPVSKVENERRRRQFGRERKNYTLTQGSHKRKYTHNTKSE